MADVVTPPAIIKCVHADEAKYLHSAWIMYHHNKEHHQIMLLLAMAAAGIVRALAAPAVMTAADSCKLLR